MRTTITIEGPDLGALEQSLHALAYKVQWSRRNPRQRDVLTAYAHKEAHAEGLTTTIIRIEEPR